MHVETETIHWTLCTCFSKLHYHVEIWTSFFTHSRFWNIRHWSFWKYWLMDLCRSSNCWHISLPNFKNSHSLIAVLVSGEKSMGIGELSSSPVFIISIFFFLLKAQTLSLAKSIVSHFPSSLCSFSRKWQSNTYYNSYYKYPVWINRVCLSFQAKVGGWDKGR